MISYIDMWYHIWYHTFISLMIWYHIPFYDIILWYHVWYHGVTRFTRFLGHVISSIFHDITHDIMPFSLHHMTQETGKSCHTWFHTWYHVKKQWFHNYMISHNCDIANYVMSYVIWPQLCNFTVRWFHMWCHCCTRNSLNAGTAWMSY